MDRKRRCSGLNALVILCHVDEASTNVMLLVGERERAERRAYVCRWFPGGQDLIKDIIMIET